MEERQLFFPPCVAPARASPDRRDVSDARDVSFPLLEPLVFAGAIAAPELRSWLPSPYAVRVVTLTGTV